MEVEFLYALDHGVERGAVGGGDHHGRRGFSSGRAYRLDDLIAQRAAYPDFIGSRIVRCHPHEASMNKGEGGCLALIV